MKLREYSHPRERVPSVRHPRFVEKEKVVDAETDEAEGILTGWRKSSLGQSSRPIKLREYSHTRERVRSVN
jgi:hypothetical protein